MKTLFFILIMQCALGMEPPPAHDIIKQKAIKDLEERGVSLDPQERFHAAYLATLCKLHSEYDEQIMDTQIMVNASNLLKFFYLGHGRYQLTKRSEYAHHYVLGMYLIDAMGTSPANFYNVYYQVDNSSGTFFKSEHLKTVSLITIRELFNEIP